ncbi:MAG: nucleoside monophosphate kinase [Spirochaetales bacterium]|nr:nucleoside monophosphate kinase [Spirochaetales bacterium]
MKLVFFGAPGAGKGTIAKILFDEKKIVHISTGDLFREAIKNMTELGQKVSSILEKGELVPDELTIALVEERTKKPDCAKGYILDGFPRTMVQAERWEEIDPIDTAVYFDIDDELVRKRLSGRRMCPKCGAIYNIFFSQPKKEGLCDNDGETLFIRKDDGLETINNRLSVYHGQTEPLLGFYKNLNKEIAIDASVSADESYKQIKGKLGL